MVHINWTIQAAQDLENIFKYISNDSRKYAELHILRLKNKTKLLVKYPKSGRIVPEYNNENIRELIYGNYRIIYRIVSNERVDIITVFHTSRILI